MRLNPKDKMFGFPVLKVREVIRLGMREELFFETIAQIYHRISNKTRLSRSDSKKLFNALINSGFFEIKMQPSDHSRYREITPTEEARRIGVARANPPISREKANVLLGELKERINAINLNDEYAYKITRLIVFGSYLGNQNILGDVDVGVRLDKRFEGKEQSVIQEKRLELAMLQGRRFNSFFNEIEWPLKEVKLLLGTRKKGLSLHYEGEDEVLKIVQFKVLFPIEEN